MTLGEVVLHVLTSCGSVLAFVTFVAVAIWGGAESWS